MIKYIRFVERCSFENACLKKRLMIRQCILYIEDRGISSPAGFSAALAQSSVIRKSWVFVGVTVYLQQKVIFFFLNVYIFAKNLTNKSADEYNVSNGLIL